MFGIGLPELILIMALALIVVGPDKLPDLAKTVAKQLLQLKKTASDLKDTLQEELKEEERPWEQLEDNSKQAESVALDGKGEGEEGDTSIRVNETPDEDVYQEAVRASSVQEVQAEPDGPDDEAGKKNG
ncbi:MAG: Sec-independent protein translocase protein TatB [Desulfobulbaceae bacterium]|nr:Sec-independent protein translocase protein TatB [Desulfobulbaceae bacterium]